MWIFNLLYAKIICMKRISWKYYFIWTSILFTIFLIVFFGYRFVHFYNLSHVNTKGLTNLTEILESNVQYVKDGVHREDNIYFFYGKDVNNYVYYSGRVWRVISVDSKGQVKLIEDIPETLIYYGQNVFEKSYVYTWLNSNFLPTIKDNSYLVEGLYCVDSFDDEVGCNTKIGYNAGLLSAKEYEQAGGKNSYLNTGVYTWLINTNTQNNPWYISNEGALGVSKTVTSLGVKPVITLKANIDITGGDGSESNPYVFVQNSPKTIADLYVGEYLTYSGYTWRVMSQGDTTKLIMSNTLENKYTYSNYDNKYNIKYYNSVAYYLNNSFYYGLSDNSLIVNTTFNTGIYEEDYSKINSTVVEAKVGLPSVGDNFSYINKSNFTINPTGKATQAVYTSLAEGRLYSDSINETEYVRPVITIKNDSAIVNGVGTIQNPYVLR